MRSKGEAAVLAVMSLVFLDSLELLFSLAAPSSNAAVVGLRNFTNTDLALIESFWSIAFGNYSLVFWVVLVLIGLILPFSLDLVYTHMRRPRRARHCFFRRRAGRWLRVAPLCCCCRRPSVLIATGVM